MSKARNMLIKNWASFLGGFLTFVVGFFLLTLWSLKDSSQSSIAHHFLIIQLSTILTLIMGGAAVIFLDVHYRTCSLILSLVGALVAISSLSYYFFYADLGIELLMPHYKMTSALEYLGRMVISTSIALTLVNFSIIFLSSKKHEVFTGIAIVLSAAASTLSLINLVTHVFSVSTSFSLFGFSKISILSALMCFILSVAVFLFGAKYLSGSRLKYISLPISVIIIILSATITLWQTFRAQEFFSLQRFSQQKINNLQLIFNERIQKEFEIFERIANRWEVLQTFSSKLWYIDAEHYIDQTIAINEIALYNKDLEKEKIAIKHPESSIDFPKELLPSEITRLKNEEVVAKPAKNKDFLSFYFPLVINREFFGFVAAEVNLVALLKHEIKILDLEEYKVSLYYENTDLFSRNLYQASITDPIYANVASQFGPWKIKLSLTKDVILEGFLSIHSLILITGIFIALLTGALVFFAQNLGKQKKSLEESNLMLEEASKKAVAANAAKGTFLATMSHEIRTPLNAVIGTAELLQETETTEVQKKYIERILSSSVLLLELIGSILDFSKIEVGDLILEKEPIDFLSLIRSVATDLSLKNTKENVDIFVEYPSQLLPKLILDPVRIQQVLSNLGNNALKFTEKGYLILRTTIKERSEEAFLIHFEVEDTGIGISKENQDKVFHKFIQVEDTLSRKFGGVGLGLSICKKLVDAMDGKIGVSGEEGKGAIFWIELSFTPSKEDLVLSYSIANKSILLLDDKEIEREIIKRYLTDWGASVDVTKKSKKYDFTISSKLDESYDNKTILICDLGKEPDKCQAARIIFRPILPNELYKSLEG